MTYGGFKRMTSFCKTAIPAEISEHLEKIKDSDEAVKAFGIELGTQMCRRLLEAGTPGLHMYTLNLESTALAILQRPAVAANFLPSAALMQLHLP